MSPVGLAATFDITPPLVESLTGYSFHWTTTSTVAATSGTFPSGTAFKWVLTAGFDLYGDARDLGGWGGGTIGTAPVPDYSGETQGTSKTVTTSVPTVMFAENGFGADTWGPDFSWTNELVLKVTVMDAGGNVLQTATTMIQTQLPVDILLP